MTPVVLFFAAATLIGCLVRGIVALRLRTARLAAPAAFDGDLCELEHAARISTYALTASLAGLAIAGLSYAAVAVAAAITA